MSSYYIKSESAKVQACGSTANPVAAPLRAARKEASTPGHITFTARPGNFGARYDFRFNDESTLSPSVGSRCYIHTKYDNEWSPDAALTLDWLEKVQLFANGSRGVHYPGVYTRAVSADYASDTLTAETMDYVSGGT